MATFDSLLFINLHYKQLPIVWLYITQEKCWDHEKSDFYGKGSLYEKLNSAEHKKNFLLKYFLTSLIKKNFDTSALIQNRLRYMLKRNMLSAKFLHLNCPPYDIDYSKFMLIDAVMSKVFVSPRSLKSLNANSSICILHASGVSIQILLWQNF